MCRFTTPDCNFPEATAGSPSDWRELARDSEASYCHSRHSPNSKTQRPSRHLCPLGLQAMSWNDWSTRRATFSEVWSYGLDQNGFAVGLSTSTPRRFAPSFGLDTRHAGRWLGRLVWSPYLVSSLGCQMGAWRLVFAHLWQGIPNDSGYSGVTSLVIEYHKYWGLSGNQAVDRRSPNSPLSCYSLPSLWCVRVAYTNWGCRGRQQLPRIKEYKLCVWTWRLSLSKRMGFCAKLLGVFQIAWEQTLVSSRARVLLSTHWPRCQDWAEGTLSDLWW